MIEIVALAGVLRCCLEPIFQVRFCNVLYPRICFQFVSSEASAVKFFKLVLIGMKPGLHHLYHPENRVPMISVPVVSSAKRLRKAAHVRPLAIRQKDVPDVLVRSDCNVKTVACGGTRTGRYQAEVTAALMRTLA